MGLWKNLSTIIKTSYIMNKHHLLNQRFGKLVVVEAPLLENGKISNLRHCVCDCGAHINVASKYLRASQILSCGCEPIPFRIESLWKQLYQDSVLGPNRRRNFTGENISFEDFISECSKPCSYCGAEPSGIKKERPIKRFRKTINSPISSTQIMYSGLDKIDPKGFYEKNNIRPSCHKCNWMKNDSGDVLLLKKKAQGVNSTLDLSQPTPEIVNGLKEKSLRLQQALSDL